MSNDDQADYWGGDAGDTWVAQQAVMDTLLTPVLDAVIAQADLRPGQSLLDVGCGTGHSTLAAAQVTGPDGHVLGADISPPMLALARARAADAAGVDFLDADVAEHEFVPASFDRVISRFGVMFFADSVAAFRNIAAAMKPGAQLCFASWGLIEENPFFTLPARIARATLGAPPKSDPDGPGPFAFRDTQKVTGILQSAGFQRVEVKVLPMALSLPEGPRAIARLSTHIGPAASALTYFEADASARQNIEDQLAEAIAALPNSAVPASINVFTAER